MYVGSSKNRLTLVTVGGAHCSRTDLRWAKKHIEGRLRTERRSVGKPLNKMETGLFGESWDRPMFSSEPLSADMMMIVIPLCGQ